MDKLSLNLKISKRAVLLNFLKRILFFKLKGFTIVKNKKTKNK
jgi:hypothetical protein